MEERGQETISRASAGSISDKFSLPSTGHLLSFFADLLGAGLCLFNLDSCSLQPSCVPTTGPEENACFINADDKPHEFSGQKVLRAFLFRRDLPATCVADFWHPCRWSVRRRSAVPCVRCFDVHAPLRHWTTSLQHSFPTFFHFFLLMKFYGDRQLGIADMLRNRWGKQASACAVETTGVNGWEIET